MASFFISRCGEMASDTHIGNESEEGKKKKKKMCHAFVWDKKNIINEKY